jgi:hypothetical protein
VTAETIPCTRCGDFIDPSAATYNNDGELVCKGCEAREQIDEGDNRAAMAAFGIAAGAAAFGFTSSVLDPCLLFTIGATLSALSAIRLVADANLRKRMGWRVYPTSALIVLALVFGPGRFAFAILFAAASVAGQ